VIGGLVQAGRVVVELVARRRDIRGAAVVRRHFDGVHQTLGQPLRRDVLPGRAAISRDVHQPIVTAGPDDALLVRRLGDVGERAVVLGADGFVGEWAAALALLVLLVARQVGRYLFPRPAHVTRLHQDLRAVVDGVRLVLAPDDGRIPVVAVLDRKSVVEGRRVDRGGRRL